MKTSVLFSLLGATALAATSCTVQTPVKQPRELSDFHTVSSGGGIDVVLTQGANPSVVVEASPQAQKELQTQVKDGTLRIGWERGFSWQNPLGNRGKVVVYVTAPRLTGLSLSGGSDAKGTSALNTDEFRIDASGGSDVKLSLNSKTLRVQASGGSDVELDGRVERQQVDISGGSDYHALALQSTTASISASGGSDANVAVDGELSSEASGGSDVRYKGSPRVNSSHSGGGSVRRLR